VLAPFNAWLHDHFSAVVFLGTLVDAVGIPFPGRLMLISVGSLSGPLRDPRVPALLVIGLAVAGTVVGDHVWYLLGRVRGRRLFDAYCRVTHLSKARVETADRLIRRYGGLAVVVSRIAAALRLVIIPLAVSRGMSYGRFLLFDVVGAVLWVTGWVWLGHVAGAVAGRTGRVGTVAVVGVVIATTIAMSVLARRWLSGRARS
jgi:membrane protein DedA with SNARE-associated domain